ncbi:MAG: ribonuclease R [Bacteroidota bacterium]
MKKRLLLYLSRMPGEPVTLKDLSKHLRTKAKLEYTELREVVDELLRDGTLEKDDRGRIAYAPRRKGKGASGRLVGKFRVSRRDGAFVDVENSGERIAVAPRFSHTAIDGDTVAVALLANPTRGRKKDGEAEAEGEVVEVVQRSTRTITGTLQIGTRFAFVIPDDGRLPRDIYIPKDELHGAQDGNKVVVRLRPWLDEHQNPEGEIIEVLGPAGDARAEVLSVARNFDLPTEFPAGADEEAAAFPERIPAEDVAGRLDLRDRICFTIDPEDAKDFDDAVSIESTRGGASIGVHIADVSHYVREGSALDREALARGTSVYLANEVIPMLPERLSNGLCSLRPQEDRLTYSVIMDVSDDGSVRDYRIAKSIIRSRRRFSYEEVQRILDTGKGEFAEQIGALWKVAQTLLKRRRKNGSLDFETAEMKFRFDAEGLPTAIIKKTRLESHRLIEECMLLANRIVAGHIGAKKGESGTKPFLYRVHDVPDPERMRDLAQFVKQFGFSLEVKSGVTAKELQKLLTKADGSEVENVINDVAIRAMAKAVYSDKNIGHFGLAFTHYTHFTSPIRRYPDLVVHRLLRLYEKTVAVPVLDQIRNRLPEIGRQSSERERVAMDAERMSVRVMQVEYMKRHVGDEFDGVIVGVTKFGLFVKIDELLVEGLVHISDLADDYYLYDEKQFALRGRSRGRVYRLGDKARVRVLGVNPEEHQIQFLPA